MNLDKITNWSLPLENYYLNEINNLPHNFLKIEINNNIPTPITFEVLPNGHMEQRQQSIFSMIKKVCEKFEIPNTSFVYCTHDRSPFDGPFFTHAKLKNTITKNIIAPCFSLDSYPEGPNSITKYYEDTYLNLIESSNLEWDKKENSCIFVGHIGENNNRLDNTNILLNENVKLQLFNQQSTATNFINREDLSKYKYLLHLNGNGGAYASRLKYLLGTNSLVFYNYNSGDESNFWQEWWMMDDFFIDGVHFISCKDKFELQDKINFYHKNQQECQKISKNGFNFFKDNLHPDVILNYWRTLLIEYTKKLK